MELMDRIIHRLDVGLCWEWTGGLYKNGYGQISLVIDGKASTTTVHRCLWKLLVGDLSDDLQLDHLCRNRKCANPDHLEPVTPAVNAQRGFGLAKQLSQRSHCKHGHEYTEENTQWNKQRGGQLRRVCRACNRRKAQDIRDRRKAAVP